MIKKVSEQDGSPFGLTEWWELSKKYRAIIFFPDKCSLLFSDPLNRNIDEMLYIAYELIPDLDNKPWLEYRRDNSGLNAHRIYFPLEKKMEALEVLDKVIADNSIF